MKKVVIIGGGHAGIEAANAVGKLGIEAVLITSDIKTIGMTPCNPSIGGPAKGNVVSEVDALGGLMGMISDQTMIQIKRLNRSKGPAIQAIRAQIDKEKYPKVALKMLKENNNVTIIEDMVESLIVKDNTIYGVKTTKEEILANKVIITTGTYLDSYIIKGHDKIFSGPDDTKTSSKLSNNLKDLGFEMFRLKTGTPARVKRSSIDFSKASVAPGDNEKIKFSHFKDYSFDYSNQEDCYLIYTNEKTHDIILSNLDKGPIDTGLIEGVGARYCPSIEDKLIRFSDKNRHQLFLEPEGRDSQSIYVQGFSTSMPDDIQLEMLRSLEGFLNVEVLKYGYAIEYEAIFPEQLKHTLETKKIKGLYSAGQVNGTSGYEEAAGQGIIAGINAALSVKKEDPFILTRADSYIGLMIDDLVTKGTKEPYRLLTSRSEYRLFLRNDNSDFRLSKKAYDIGMLDKDNFKIYCDKKDKVEKLLEFSKSYNVSPKEINQEVADKLNTNKLNHGIKLYDFIKRPNIEFKYLKDIIDLPIYNEEVFEIVQIEIKYEGYLNKVKQEIEKFSKNENKNIPEGIDYNFVDNLALEAREKFNKIKPETIGQASRISGINPADISILIMYLKRKEENDRKN